MGGLQRDPAGAHSVCCVSDARILKRATQLEIGESEERFAGDRGGACLQQHDESVTSGQRTGWRKLRCVPASTDGLDQEDTGIHLSPKNVDFVSLVEEKSGLCGDNLQVGIGASFVEIGEQPQVLLRFPHRLFLLSCFLREDSERGQIVFYLLKCFERCLAISRNGCVVVSLSLLHTGSTAAGIVDDLGCLRADRPDAAGPGE